MYPVRSGIGWVISSFWIMIKSYWHGQNGNLSNWTVLSMDSTGSLINGRQVSIQITWIRSSARHLFSGSGYFSKWVSVCGHIGHNDQDMQFLFISQILGCCQGQSWGNDSFDCGIVGQVQEQDDSLHRTILLEVCFEKSGNLHVYTHCCEDDAEVFLWVICDIFSFD
jgi:hypothetical protein